MLRHSVLLSLCAFSIITIAEESVTLPADIELKGVAMHLIPEGEFVMGSDNVEKEGLQNEFGSVKPFYLDEHPKHKVKLPAYYIGKYEVTNQHYMTFIKDTKRQPPMDWVESGYVVSMKKEKLNDLPIEKLRTVASERFRIDVDTRNLTKEQLLEVINKHFSAIDQLPVRNINWFDAQAFCEWDGAKLPTEEQWERAARGNNANEFPWGNEFEPGLSNTGDEDWPFGVSPVGSYKSDKSLFEIYDLAGNVSEWVFDWYNPYTGSDYKSEQFGEKFKVIRGAGWGGTGHYALQLYQRGAYRQYLSPDDEHEDLGFRCASEAQAALKQIAALGAQ